MVPGDDSSPLVAQWGPMENRRFRSICFQRFFEGQANRQPSMLDGMESHACSIIFDNNWNPFSFRFVRGSVYESSVLTMTLAT